MPTISLESFVDATASAVRKQVKDIRSHLSLTDRGPRRHHTGFPNAAPTPDPTCPVFHQRGNGVCGRALNTGLEPGVERLDIGPR